MTAACLPIVEPDRASVRRRRGSLLVACVLSSALLHSAMLAGVGRLLARDSLGGRAATGPVPAVRLVARDAPAIVPTPTGSMSPVPAATVPPGALARSAAPRTGITRPSATPDAPAEADPDTQGYRFFNANEVDATAEPILGWNLDPAALDALLTSRIVFTVFIGRDGSILHCSVDEPTTLSLDQRRSLETRLAETEMRPAWRAGRPVPSRRRIELFTVGGI